MTTDDLQRNLFIGYCALVTLGVSAVAVSWYDYGKDVGETEARDAFSRSILDGDFVIGPMFDINNPDYNQEYLNTLKKLKTEAELKAAMLDQNVSMEECVSKARVLMDCDKAVQLVKEKIAAEKENKENAKEEA